MTEVTRGFCWHKNFVPWGCLPLTCGYIHLLNHEKMCIKSEAEDILFKLATNDHSDEPSCWHKTFGPNGLSAPAQRLCLNFFSAITADFNISSALRWAIQDQWSSVFFEYPKIFFHVCGILIQNFLLTAVVSAWLEMLVLQTLDHGVIGSNLTEDKILSEIKWHFIVTPFQSSYNWNTVKRGLGESMTLL